MVTFEKFSLLNCLYNDIFAQACLLLGTTYKVSNVAHGSIVKWYT